MKLEKAFSKEPQLRITATEADKQFQNGVIKSKFKFSCPDEKCDAQVTCANLDKKKSEKENPITKLLANIQMIA